MKTILTLIAFISISSVALAGEKHPSVTVTSTGEYKIVIDGKQFNNEKKISLMICRKEHTISMYGKRRKDYSVVSTSLFHQSSLNWQIRDLDIDVNFSGYITIGKQGKGWDGDKWYKQDKNKKNDSRNK